MRKFYFTDKPDNNRTVKVEKKTKSVKPGSFQTKTDGYRTNVPLKNQSQHQNGHFPDSKNCDRALSGHIPGTFRAFSGHFPDSKFGKGEIKIGQFR